MANTKKSRKSVFSNNSYVSVLTVVLLVACLGSVALPSIFADTSKGSTTSITATPGNGSAYSVSVSWTGTTPDHWHGEYYKNGVRVDGWASSSKSKGFNGLTCGATYLFKVAPINSKGDLTNDYKQASAVPRCPTVGWTRFAASGNTVTASWANTAGAGFAGETYTLYLKTGGGAYVASNTASSGTTINGSCNTPYSAYLRANAGAQSGPVSNIVSTTTAACPSSVKKTVTTPKSTPKAPATSAAPAPAAPTGFAAEVHQKTVSLSWDAVSGADHYDAQRSTDDATWQDLGTVQTTSYDDATADYDTAYYYQLTAVGGDGQVSAPASVLATTDSYVASSNTIVSDDKLVLVSIPSGAIDADHDCSLDFKASTGGKLPSGQSAVVGPYLINCSDDNGDPITSFKKPLKVTIKLGANAKSYKNFTIRTLNKQTWSIQKSTYDSKKQQISFNLTSQKTFAAFGTKHHSVWGILWPLLLVLLLIGALVGGLLWRRRRSSNAMPAAVATKETPEQAFQDALAQPTCSHLGMAQAVTPSSQGCYECEQQHTTWNSLRICLICGHVGCSDDSPEQHALKHYQQTGHPLVYDYNNPAGNSIGWCYADQTYI